MSKNSLIKILQELVQLLTETTFLTSPTNFQMPCDVTPYPSRWRNTGSHPLTNLQLEKEEILRVPIHSAERRTWHKATQTRGKGLGWIVPSPRLSSNCFIFTTWENGARTIINILSRDIHIEAGFDRKLGREAMVFDSLYVGAMSCGWRRLFTSLFPHFHVCTRPARHVILYQLARHLAFRKAF